MKRFATAALCAAVSFTCWAGRPQLLQISGDSGCFQLESQNKRLLWTEIAFRATQQRAAGTLKPDLAAAADRAVNDLVALSKTDCRPLYGEYRVLERATLIDGASKAARVRISPKESLWVLTD